MIYISSELAKPAKFEKEPVKPLINTKSRLIEEDQSKCTKCLIVYDKTGNRNAPNRKITESCGHSICFTCFKMMMIQGSDCSLCGDCVICKQTCRDCNSENVPQISADTEEVEGAISLRNTAIDDTFAGDGDSFPV